MQTATLLRLSVDLLGVIAGWVADPAVLGRVARVLRAVLRQRCHCLTAVPPAAGWDAWLTPGRTPLPPSPVGSDHGFSPVCVRVWCR